MTEPRANHRSQSDPAETIQPQEAGTSEAAQAGSSSLDVLRELFATATHDASAAMCRWTNGLITLTLDAVHELPIEEVCTELHLVEDPLTIVVLSLPGDIGGDMFILFDQVNGRRLVASLLGRPVAESSEWTSLETSALTETGNILGCAYLNALTRMIDMELIPSAPYFLEDYGASVIEQALAAQAMTSDKAMICRTGFHHQQDNLSWRVLFLPTQGMRTALQRTLVRSR